MGIISVVAAMTIGVINKASWEMEQKTRFKKVYSTLNNAILKIRADYGYYPECYYNETSGYSNSECLSFFTEFKQQLAIIKSCTNNSYTNGCIPYYGENDAVSNGCDYFSQANILSTDPSYVLKDGTIIVQYKTAIPFILVDINGQKLPNKYGHDVFLFKWFGDNDYLKLTPTDCFTPETGGKTSSQMFEDAFK